MTSAPPPPEGWDFHHSETPPAEAAEATPSKPKFTALALTLGIVLGLVGVAGASSATLKVITGSFLPTTASNATEETPPPDDADEDTDPALDVEPEEPSFQTAAAFVSLPEHGWEVTVTALLKAAGIDDEPDTFTLSLVAPESSHRPNATDIQAVQLSGPALQLLAGIDTSDGAVRWTHILGEDDSSWPNCFTVNRGEHIGCEKTDYDTGGSLVFLNAAFGDVVAAPKWAHQVWFIAGTGSDVLIGGATKKGALYIAGGSMTDPDGSWFTKSKKNLVRAQGLWNRDLTFDASYAQFTLNNQAIVVDTKTGDQLSVVEAGFADVVPDVGAVLTLESYETALLGSFTVPGSAWGAVGEHDNVRPVLGAGRSLYDAQSGTPLWTLPAAEGSILSDDITLLPKHALRTNDTSKQSNEKRLTAYDSRTGTELWSQIQSPFEVLATQDDIVVGLSYRNFIPVAVQALDLRTGEEHWELPLKLEESSAYAQEGANNPVQINGGTLLLLEQDRIIGMVATP